MCSTFRFFHWLWFFAFRALHCCARSCAMHHQFFRAVVFRRFVYSTLLPGQYLTRRSSGTAAKARQPLNFTLGAMRIMLNFSVLRGVDRAVGFIACSVLFASRLVVELLVQHVQVSSMAVVFCVSCASLLRSLLCNASPVFTCGSFSPFCLQHAVARSAPN